MCINKVSSTIWTCTSSSSSYTLSFPFAVILLSASPVISFSFFTRASNREEMMMMILLFLIQLQPCSPVQISYLYFTRHPTSDMILIPFFKIRRLSKSSLIIQWLSRSKWMGLFIYFCRDENLSGVSSIFWRHHTGSFWWFGGGDLCLLFKVPLGDKGAIYT